tara:strand:- start:52 stop:333 length:282 start_codon:yes stop_codon:yes gene_type:complete
MKYKTTKYIILLSTILISCSDKYQSEIVYPPLSNLVQCNPNQYWEYCTMSYGYEYHSESSTIYADCKFCVEDDFMIQGGYLKDTTLTFITRAK